MHCWNWYQDWGYCGLTNDDVIKWKHFPRNWPFVWGIHRSPVNSLHKGQWRGALMFSLICAWINDWVNNREAGHLRRYRTSLWRHRNAITWESQHSRDEAEGNSEIMMTSSNGDIFSVTGYLCGDFTGEFTSQRPVTRSFDVFFDLHLIKRLSKQLCGWWFDSCL